MSISPSASNNARQQAMQELRELPIDSILPNPAQPRRRFDEAELQALLTQFAKETPAHFPATFHVAIKGLNDPFVDELGHTLFLLFGAVTLLLAIGFRHPPLINRWEPIDRARLIWTGIAVLIFILCFMPMPVLVR